MTLLQVRAGGSGKEPALELERVEAGLDLVVEAAGAVVEAGVEGVAAKRDSADGGKGRELPSFKPPQVR